MESEKPEGGRPEVAAESEMSARLGLDIRIKKFSPSTNISDCHYEVRRLIKKEGNPSARKIRDAWIDIWRAKIGNNLSVWFYGTSPNEALSKALDHHARMH